MVKTHVMDDKLAVTQLDALMKEAHALAQEAEARKREAAIWAEIARRGGASVPGAGAPQVSDKPVSDIAKLPLADAVFEDLKAAKQPKTPQQIWRTLEAAGYEAQTDTPEESVKWALKKLLIRNPDVVHVGWNTWHLRSKYSKARLERLMAKRAGKGGRTTEDHVARTLEGMEKAKARGKLGHRPSKINADNVVIFKQMVADGASNSAIAKALGISVATVYAHRRDVESWSIGEAWPPQTAENSPSDDAEKSQSHIRLVK